MTVVVSEDQTLGRIILPTILFFVKIALAILGPMSLHINFRISLAMSTKNLVRDFDRNWECIG